MKRYTFFHSGILLDLNNNPWGYNDGVDFLDAENAKELYELFRPQVMDQKKKEGFVYVPRVFNILETVEL